MKTYIEKLKILIADIENSIAKKIDKIGVPAKNQSQWKCIKIQDENFQFNLDGNRYLVEVTDKCLIDNSGYTYDYHSLQFEELVELADYIMSLKGGKVQ